MNRTSRLLPVVLGVVGLMLVFVVLRSCTGEDTSVAVMEAVPLSPVPDADTPADTIKTLTANVAAMTAEVEALRQEGQRLREENRALLEDDAQVEENLLARIRREWQMKEQAEAHKRQADTDRLESLAARIEALSQSLVSSREQGADMPVGASASEHPGHARGVPLVWLEPLEGSGPDAAMTGASATALAAHTPPSLFPVDEPEPASPQPAYTVPRNATLLGSTALTALVGRVPVQGQVRDAMPFKVITGADNLAANGLTVPGVHGMVWSGTAIGDWTLSCVTGRLDSVTFVFEDGTIHTHSADSGSAGSDSQALGWISDAQGVPCIHGERKTNAPAFLAQRIGMVALQAAAEAAAAAQTTTVINDAGTASGHLTGDAGAFVLGKSVSSTSEEVGRWLAERQSQSFDAVFVPAGARLAIHVLRELPIDHDPFGRRLDHARTPDHDIHARLD
ncbi:MAG: TIGR03752 family integrating conjugative element protein [Gammaproteobacteria bacterium]|nr:TIGR03752 family integrating conjugative element protein [Gammaproteobacteria bacterium]